MATLSSAWRHGNHGEDIDRHQTKNKNNRRLAANSAENRSKSKQWRPRAGAARGGSRRAAWLSCHQKLGEAAHNGACGARGGGRQSENGNRNGNGAGISAAWRGVGGRSIEMA